jgi:hypothetical protein
MGHKKHTICDLNLEEHSNDMIFLYDMLYNICFVGQTMSILDPSCKAPSYRLTEGVPNSDWFIFLSPLPPITKSMFIFFSFDKTPLAHYNIPSLLLHCLQLTLSCSRNYCWCSRGEVGTIRAKGISLIQGPIHRPFIHSPCTFLLITILSLFLLDLWWYMPIRYVRQGETLVCYNFLGWLR